MDSATLRRLLDLTDASFGNEESQRLRQQKLSEHSNELLIWYSQRVGELEIENRELRRELLKAVRMPCPDQMKIRRRPTTFLLDGADEECETTCEHIHSSTSNIFDADWNNMSWARYTRKQYRRGRTRSTSQVSQVSSAMTSEPSLNPNTVDSIGADVPQGNNAEDVGAMDNRDLTSATNHLLALEKLLRSLNEQDAELIWQQFARFECETDYLRSVIRAYEDICLRGSDDGNPFAESESQPEQKNTQNKSSVLSRSLASTRNWHVHGPDLTENRSASRQCAKEGQIALSGCKTPLSYSRVRSLSNPTPGIAGNATFGKLRSCMM